jgi:hypothetical protein
MYEVLPYVYMVAGAGALMGIEIIYAKICGGLLFTAGWVIRGMRKQYRKNSLVDPATISSRWN